MTTSDQINEIAGALAKAQGEMGGAMKDASNPFFKSKYADLASVRDAVQGPFAKHGIAYVQSPSTQGSVVSVITLLAHTSGQWMRGELSCTAKDDSPQAVGSAITYLRRYALQSFAGVTPEDDDGEAAQGRKNGQAQQPARQANVAPMPPKGYSQWLLDLEAVADEGTASLQDAWKQSHADMRAHLTSTAPATWEAIKTRAARVPVGVGA